MALSGRMAEIFVHSTKEKERTTTPASEHFLKTGATLHDMGMEREQDKRQTPPQRLPPFALAGISEQINARGRETTKRCGGENERDTHTHNVAIA